MTVKDKRWFGPKEVAERLNITVKTLRVYEREGLIEPQRTEADWRVYGPEDVERLHLILAMRDFGLSLKRIKALLSGRQTSLASILAVQQDLLEEQRRRLDRGIAPLVAARDQIRQGHSLSLDDLIRLAQESRMPKNTSLHAVFEKTLKAQFPDIADAALAHIDHAVANIAIPTVNFANTHSGRDLSELKATFECMMDEAARLMAMGSETSEEAKALVLVWNAQAIGLPKAEPSVGEAIKDAFMASLQDRQAARPQLFDPEVFRFIFRVAEGMRKRGEL